jgi:hypothetical protein
MEIEVEDEVEVEDEMDFEMEVKDEMGVDDKAFITPVVSLNHQFGMFSLGNSVSSSAPPKPASSSNLRKLRFSTNTDDLSVTNSSQKMQLPVLPVARLQLLPLLLIRQPLSLLPICQLNHPSLMLHLFPLLFSPWPMLHLFIIRPRMLRIRWFVLLRAKYNQSSAEMAYYHSQSLRRMFKMGK